MSKTAQTLPQDKTQAINTLIQSTKALINIAEREGQLLAQNDMINFYVLQDEKELLAKRYEALSQEFRARLEEFRGIDHALLDRLENAQRTLGEKATHNNEIVEKIRERAQRKTQNSLLTVQELAQQKPVRFNGKKEGAA